MLEARLAKGNGDEILLWEKAVALQDGLMQDDPPAWDFPVSESLAAAFLRSGRVAAAEAMFREDLQHNPRNPRGLFGLWHSLKAQHNTVAASWVQKQFEDAWKNADSQLRIEDF